MTSEKPAWYSDLASYAALPRLSGLILSPDGSRLVTQVATPSQDGSKYVNALWRIDPSGQTPAQPLTRTPESSHSPTFAHNGDLLFLSARPSGLKDAPDKAPTALWRLPADGGEARLVAWRRGGIDQVVAAASCEATVVKAGVLVSAANLDDDDRLAKARAEGHVNAILQTAYPVRFWDQDLGPAKPQLLAVDAAQTLAPPRQLTPGAGSALWDCQLDITPGGDSVVTTWDVPMSGGSLRVKLVRLDYASGQAKTLIDDPVADLSHPAISPDGKTVAYIRWEHTTPTDAKGTGLWLTDIDGGEPRQIAASFDRVIDAKPVWLPDGSGLLLVADDQGRAPVFHVALASGTVTKLTSDVAAFSDVNLSPDGATVYALRSSYTAPPAPVRFDLTQALAADGNGIATTALPGPAEVLELPGRLEELRFERDGVDLRAFLVLPAAASPAKPAPLLLWIHGGPVSSWNAWSWRWNPWLMAAVGYAVLLPDPALSTGYGLDFINRGQDDWGGAPFEDLMTATDVAIARPDIDATRTAAMGGSFGGYMANWVAGHTDRFKAIVTHASLWHLPSFYGTTDMGFYWEREFTPEGTERSNPSPSVARIATPMLVIHGDKDYRVPISEGLRLWWDLLSRSALAAGDDGTSPHRFLYFPDENHWVLTPAHAQIWYGTVLAFLARHVLDLPEEQAPAWPELLG
ncbi:MAG: S9 family peptidase [Bifidobacteriaceae bacterium]|nr:S9 family peptidase [Bifidobacteriaceae bacterium]